eukprot:2431081-Pleurochrysis_carterae.AAC.1
MRFPEAWTRKRKPWGKRMLHREAGPPARRTPEKVRPPRRGGTSLCMPERAMTASLARTGKSQLWPRPCHPQLVKKLGYRFTPTPASAPYAAPLPLADQLVAAEAADRAQVGTAGAGEGSERRRGRRDGADDISEVSQALRLWREPVAGATRCALRQQAEV